MSFSSYSFKNFTINPFDFSDKSLITETIDLLNEENHTQKHNLDFWSWRFNQSPFGQSFGWYARHEQSGKLAGVLLWWPWQFRFNNQNIVAFQAINGKTSSLFRNSGIFLEFNNVATSFFESNNIILFGFPNNQSYPSYVKMKWQTVSFVHPFIFPVGISSILPYGLFDTKQQHSRYNEISFESEKVTPQTIHTEWSDDIMDWRFRKHPRTRYQFYSQGSNLVVYKIKKRGKFNEAQIVLSQLDEDFSLKYFLKKISGVNFISYYGNRTVLQKLIEKKIVKYRIEKPLYFVMRNFQNHADANIRFELAETDNQ